MRYAFSYLGEQFLAICRRDWPGTLGIVATNLVPLVGVIAFGFHVFSLFLLFWLESLVRIAIDSVGTLIAHPRGKGNPWDEKLPKVMILGIIQVLFFLGYLAFIVTLFGREDFSRAAGDPVTLFNNLHLALPVTAMVVLNVVRFVVFVARGEHYRVSADAFVVRSLIRLFVVHFALIIGGVPAMLLGSPIWALLGLVVVKTVIDLATQLDTR